MLYHSTMAPSASFQTVQKMTAVEEISIFIYQKNPVATKRNKLNYGN